MHKLVTLEYSLIIYLVLMQVRDGEPTGKWKKHRKHHHDEQMDWNSDQLEGEKLLQESIGVFKGGPESYLLTFAEMRPNKKISVIGEDSFNENLFPPLWQNKTNLRKRRGGLDEEVTVSLEVTTPQVPGGQQAEVLVASGEAEEVVSSILKSTENTRKGLGVCRKFVPRNFFNPALDNTTNIVIKSIIGCVEEKLQDDLTCHDCITLHSDLQAFLYWILHGNPGMACCPSVRKAHVPDKEKHMFLFRQEAFGGVKCVTGGSLIPTMCEEVTSHHYHSEITPPERVTHPFKKTDSLSSFIRV